jgi:hypothetical protein
MQSPVIGPPNASGLWPADGKLRADSLALATLRRFLDAHGCCGRPRCLRQSKADTCGEVPRSPNNRPVGS